MILFSNTRNDCYLNAVLQALLNIKPLTDFFKNEPDDKFNIIRVFRLISSENTTVNPRFLKLLMSRIDNSARLLFNNDEQQDAHEAISKILDIIHVISCYKKINFKDYGKIDTEMKKMSLASWKRNADIFGYSFITKYFTGQFKTTILCKNPDCDYKNISFDNFNNISLALTGPDISDCFSDFIKPERMLDAKCEKCSHKTLIKTTTIWKFPAVLIINLKRFEYTNNKISRIDKFIDLDDFLYFNSSSLEYTYELESVVCHHGKTPHAGHYTANILKNNVWYKMDDDSKPEITTNKKSSSAYILIYRYDKTLEILTKVGEIDKNILINCMKSIHQTKFN